jgi:hypothetical protein
LKNTAHGIEGPKDDNSISRVSGLDGRFQGRHGVGMQAAGHVLAGVLGLPSLLK